ncbi:DUF3262 family protein [Thioalkalivibrio sp. ALE28]|uniref:DUF3262 family protein n=1 Tax=Thioalkalivibrio sp. ALE28 TaxID=1158179 RepID=UPI0003781981|nr:DUF3262 family protein [Thioalkalivibrio sp. ALE28]
MSGNAASQFEQWAGASGADLGLAIATIVAVTYLIWLMWVVMGQFRAWSDRETPMFDLIWVSVRAAVVVMLVGYFIRP